MPTKRKFFRRTKPSLGEKSEKSREKRITVKKKATAHAVLPKPTQSAPKPKRNFRFPNIYRFISETLRNQPQWTLVAKTYSRLFVKGWSWKKTLISLVAVVIVSGICVSGVFVIRAGESLSGVLSDRGKLQDQMHLWEDIAKKYPRYRDADFQIALLAYQLGDRATEQVYLAKVLQIDPNYQPALQLQNEN